MNYIHMFPPCLIISLRQMIRSKLLGWRKETCRFYGFWQIAHLAGPIYRYLHQWGPSLRVVEEGDGFEWLEIKIDI